MADGSTPLRIAFLTSAGTWRGSAVSTAHVVLGLNARGHQARMFVSEPDVASRARDRGIAVDLVPVRNTGPREVLTLRRLLHSTAIEVLVTDRPRDLRVAGYACLFSRVHLVNQFNLSRKDPPRDLSTRLACRRSQFTIFTTRRFARQVFAKAPFMSAVPWRIIGPAVDTKAFFRDDAAGRAFRTRYSLGDQPFVLAVGALVPGEALRPHSPGHGRAREGRSRSGGLRQRHAGGKSSGGSRRALGSRSGGLAWWMPSRCAAPIMPLCSSCMPVPSRPTA